MHFGSFAFEPTRAANAKPTATNWFPLNPIRMSPYPVNSAGSFSFSFGWLWRRDNKIRVSQEKSGSLSATLSLLWPAPELAIKTPANWCRQLGAFAGPLCWPNGGPKLPPFPPLRRRRLELQPVDCASEKERRLFWLVRGSQKSAPEASSGSRDPSSLTRRISPVGSLYFIHQLN